MNTSSIDALIAECVARPDHRELPADVVDAVASALADAIVADILAQQQARAEVNRPS